MMIIILKRFSARLYINDIIYIPHYYDDMHMNINIPCAYCLHICVIDVLNSKCNTQCMNSSLYAFKYVHIAVQQNKWRGTAVQYILHTFSDDKCI